ncbi:MAG: hypothetical protein ABH865_07835, partial [Candidatus Omnitrophota bacterium]
RYSSGMYVRLAFAVAAHLEPEILLVDEVLAVGDIQFQKKCLGKMDEVAKEGRTVLFVSHQMNAIRKLCKTCVWIRDGRIAMFRNTAEVVGEYEGAAYLASLPNNRHLRNSRADAEFFHWEIVEPTSGLNLLTSVGPVTFKFSVRINKAITNGVHGIELFDKQQNLLWGNAQLNFNLEPGIYDFFHTFQSLPLHPGIYYWKVSLWDSSEQLDIWNGVPDLRIGTIPCTHPWDYGSGVLNLPSSFQIKAST